MNTSKERMQYLFDTAVNGVLTQGKKSYDTVFGECIYRSDSGCKCALGHLIKDDEYNEDIEGASVTEDRVKAVLTKSLGFDSRLYESLLIQLQRAHDNSRVLNSDYEEVFLKDFEMHSKIVAKEFGLKWKFDHDEVIQ